jgi:hypothetical protein
VTYKVLSRTPPNVQLVVSGVGTDTLVVTLPLASRKSWLRRSPSCVAAPAQHLPCESIAQSFMVMSSQRKPSAASHSGDSPSTARTSQTADAVVGLAA